MPFGLPGLDWDREGPSWPLHEHSQFVDAANVRWHVQDVGQGPIILALHGTAATTHSLAPLAEHLRQDYRLIMVDLPGHGFSRISPFYKASIDRIAGDLEALMRSMHVEPQVLLGHSAGAPLALALARQAGWQDKPLIAVNGAFKPFGGLGKSLAPLMARALHINPLTSLVFANGLSDKARVRKLIQQTGSMLNDEQLSLYHRALSSSRHVAGALGMMAHWNLDPVRANVEAHHGPVHLFLGDNDKAVSPSEAEELRAAYPRIGLHRWPAQGHLLHEEAPDACAAKIRELSLA
ncbi:MAG: alpha/beta fold hydrolase [Parvularculaceae bacterium]|nr:alpha/beta fold hydrolase [Parvularculaceae bacterium]